MKLSEPSQQQIGRLGEDIAVSYLENAGYRIISRNQRIGPDEIDIIAEPADKPGYVSFIEVKTQQKTGWEHRPEDNFSARKLACLKRSAQTFCSVHQIDENLIRIEGIAITCDMRNKIANIKHFLSLM